MALTKVQGEGITGITITANNQITKSTVPAFFVYNSTNDWFSNVSAGTLIQFNTAKFNLGSHFNLSTYKFTAPVAGLYQFNIRMYVNNDSGANAWGVAINDRVYNHDNTSYPLFGDLAQGGNNGKIDYLGACASATRGLFGGGQTPTKINTIQFVTISTTGDTTSFGDLTVARRFPMGFSDVHGGLAQ